MAFNREPVLIASYGRANWPSTVSDELGLILLINALFSSVVINKSQSARAPLDEAMKYLSPFCQTTMSTCHNVGQMCSYVIVKLHRYV